jgi:tRNA (guanine37-N1)-methyltransferase|tara:strand:- start:143 stop:874 length:732 start_codon:yes stop_codon:yes gene_type:complete
MNFNILTIFPDLFDTLDHGVIGKAKNNGSFSINLHDIRKHAVNKHGQIDGKPYGGGEGMLMMPQPLKKSLEDIPKNKIGKVIYLSPQGKPLNNIKAKELSTEKSITFICGRYEGIDQRFIDKYVDEEISIGDFIISGGELAALCSIDAIVRHIPGVLGNEDSSENDTFSNGLLKGPQYSRPEIFEEMKVPDVLLSGNHEKIKEWKELKSIEATINRRPELLNNVKLTKKQRKLLEDLTSQRIL